MWQHLWPPLNKPKQMLFFPTKCVTFPTENLRKLWNQTTIHAQLCNTSVLTPNTCIGNLPRFHLYTRSPTLIVKQHNQLQFICPSGHHMATKLGLNPKQIQLIHPISLWIRSFKVKHYLVAVVDVRSDQKVLYLEQLNQAPKLQISWTKIPDKMNSIWTFKTVLSTKHKICKMADSIIPNLTKQR
jgi:hypothetical protein